MPAKRKKAVAKRGGRIFHKYPKISKTESRRLAQQKKSRLLATARRRALRNNKGGVSRHRGSRSVFKTPGWRKQLAQTRGVGSRPGRRLGKPMAHSAASLGRSNKIIRGKIGHKHGKRGGWLPIVGSLLLSMFLND